jgi:hypothetical protein
VLLGGEHPAWKRNQLWLFEMHQPGRKTDGSSLNEQRSSSLDVESQLAKADDDVRAIGDANTIGLAFNAGCCAFLRLVIVIFAVVTVVVPLLYAVFYLLTHGSFKGLADNLGLLLQPVIVANKSRNGNPRYNELAVSGPHKLFLGAQPDMYGGYRPLFARHKIRTVVSLNSDKERAGNIWMRPPTTKVYASHGVDFIKYTLGDHSPLTENMLMDSADTIEAGLEKGDVYVHCKAGQGRSAQAALAYYVKCEGKSIDNTVRDMKRDRPNITLKTLAQIELMTAGSKRRGKEQERYDFFESFRALCPLRKNTGGVAMVQRQVHGHETVTI